MTTVADRPIVSREKLFHGVTEEELARRTAERQQHEQEERFARRNEVKQARKGSQEKMRESKGGRSVGLVIVALIVILVVGAVVAVRVVAALHDRGDAGVPVQVQPLDQDAGFSTGTVYTYQLGDSTYLNCPLPNSDVAPYVVEVMSDGRQHVTVSTPVLCKQLLESRINPPSR